MPFSKDNELNLKIVVATTQDNDYIDQQIDEYNSRYLTFAKNEDVIRLDYVIKNENDEIVGGIVSFIYCKKCLYIYVLWINDQYRNMKYGSMLLNKVEDEAKKRGCTLVHLDSFDFQAKDFYLKHGYEVFGVLDECPPGHKRFYLKKDLA